MKPSSAPPPAPTSPATRSDRALARATLAFILAGGRGSRLMQLTEERAKPALAFAGKFRVIDFTLSNCVNSGVRRIGVCTQYRAQGLIRHLHRGWSFLDGRFGEFIEVLPAQQRTGTEWYQGTADAVYQNLEMVEHFDPEFILVLAGDHVYKMDYGAMLAEHAARGAAMTLACMEVPVEAAAGALGVARVDAAGRILAFDEKPAAPAPLPDRPGRCLASMGVYAFGAGYLVERLGRDARDPASGRDFGRDLIPRLIAEGEPVYAHDFARSCVGRIEGREPYWRDVGTVDSYWEANIDLTRITPDLNLYDRDWPIWTWQEQMPPAKFVFEEPGRNGAAHDSMVSAGCVVSGAQVRRSLLFNNVRVHSYGLVEDSVLLPGVDVGRRSVVRRAIIDKGCRLPEGFQVGVDPEADRRRFHVTAKGIALVVPSMLD